MSHGPGRGIYVYIVNVLCRGNSVDGWHQKMISWLQPLFISTFSGLAHNSQRVEKMQGHLKNARIFKEE